MDKNLPTKKEEEKEGLLMEEKDVWEIARERAAVREGKEITNKEISPEDEKMIRKQLRREIETMELSEVSREEAVREAKKIEFLGEEGKLERLLMLAQEKGIAYSVRVAKDMNDPYILDTFHDALVRNGYYKKFLEGR
ncbi:hypothetical protein KKC00_02695 [Patescibacteria group bacterium]|nr:hypothetical protein [Patescibacteria group bacterium]